MYGDNNTESDVTIAINDVTDHPSELLRKGFHETTEHKIFVKPVDPISNWHYFRSLLIFSKRVENYEHFVYRTWQSRQLYKTIDNLISKEFLDAKILENLIQQKTNK